MNSTKTQNGGDLFIQWSNVRATTAWRKKFRTFLNGISLRFRSKPSKNTSIRTGTKFKNIKSIERAKEIVLSKNPRNINKAVFFPYNGNAPVQFEIMVDKNTPHRFYYGEVFTSKIKPV